MNKILPFKAVRAAEDKVGFLLQEIINHMTREHLKTKYLTIHIHFKHNFKIKQLQ